MKPKPQIIATTWGRNCSITVEYQDGRITKYSLSARWRVALWLSVLRHRTGLVGAACRHLKARSNRFGVVPGPWEKLGRVTSKTLRRGVPKDERVRAELRDNPGKDDMFAAELNQLQERNRS